MALITTQTTLVLINTSLTVDNFGEDEEAAIVAALCALAFPADPQYSRVLNVVPRISAFANRRRKLAAAKLAQQQPQPLGVALSSSGRVLLESTTNDDDGGLIITVELGALWDLRGRTDASQNNLTSTDAVCDSMAESTLAEDLGSGGDAVVAAMRATAEAFGIPELKYLSVNTTASSPPLADNCATPHVPLPTPVPTSLPTLAPTPIPSPQPTDAPTPLPTLVPSLSPTPDPSSSPTPVPTVPPTDSPTPVPTSSPTPLPTLPPTPSPTGVLRGYKECFCLSAQWVSDLNTYCPSIADNFAEGCDNSLTVETMKSYFSACPALKSGFFTEGHEREG